ncbi:hypothetical protein GALL_345510 [mine drainage metagenome]|uniref:Uncharacterized protein n=1 Tax=mine drainage metagenome TaxID=410659 RepID=A0A1J5QJI4_9ZZZZ
MLWFTVWTVLVIATVVGAFFLGRDLWRKARALLDELGRASHVFGELSVQAAALAEVAASLEAVRAARDPFADPVAARRTRATVHGRVAQRRSTREERRRATAESWRRFTH